MKRLEIWDHMWEVLRERRAAVESLKHQTVDQWLLAGSTNIP
jgi:hypothetical protein